MLFVFFFLCWSLRGRRQTKRSGPSFSWKRKRIDVLRRRKNTAHASSTPSPNQPRREDREIENREKVYRFSPEKRDRARANAPPLKRSNDDDGKNSKRSKDFGFVAVKHLKSDERERRVTSHRRGTRGENTFTRKRGRFERCFTRGTVYIYISYCIYI